MEQELNELEELRENTYDEVVEEYGGKASMSTINSVAAKRTKELDKQISSLSRSLNTKITSYNSDLDLVRQEMEYEQADYQMQREQTLDTMQGIEFLNALDDRERAKILADDELMNQRFSEALSLAQFSTYSEDELNGLKETYGLSDDQMGIIQGVQRNIIDQNLAEMVEAPLGVRLTPEERASFNQMLIDGSSPVDAMRSIGEQILNDQESYAERTEQALTQLELLDITKAQMDVEKKMWDIEKVKNDIS